MSANAPLFYLLCCLRYLLLSAGYGTELPDQFDDGWTDRHENDRRQNKYHQRGNHLDGSLCSLFFGPLPAFRAEGVGMHSESLGDAGAEAICLNQCTNKGADVVNSGAIDQVAQGLGAGRASPHLKIHQVEVIAQIDMGMMEVLPNPHQSLVKGQT